MRNLIRMLMGKPVVLSPKQQEKMARMQARADASTAKGEAEARAGMAEAAAITAAARGTSVAGPAGSGAGGGGAMPFTPGEIPQSIPPLRDLLRNSMEGFRDVIGEHSDDRSGVIDPGRADFHRPVAELDDAGERERVAADERAARDAARAPYRAPGAGRIETTRFATTGRAQLDDLTVRLATLRPDQVFGVYRVADRVDEQRDGEAGAYMEWAVVHAPDAAGSATPRIASFRRQDHWVRRAPGEPSVLDEDVAGTYCARARIEPERCFGVTRLWHVVGSDSQASRSFRGVNEAVLVVADALPDAALEELQSQAPLELPSTPMLPFHLEILDWEAIAAWVRPLIGRPVRVPSPLPHLPSTPEELLEAYVGIVGLRPDDTFGVQVTRTSDGGVGDLSAAGLGTLRSLPKQPCVDGKERVRLHVAEHVVLAYRDSAAYQEGRERWRRYQDEVLRARLDHLTGVRPPVEADLRPRQSFASELFDMFNPLDPVHALPQLFGRNAPRSLGPYCGGMGA